MTPYRRQSMQITLSKHPGSSWIDQNRASLPNNRWVAASAKGKVAENAEIGELMAELKQKNIAPTDVAIAYITADAV